MSWARFKINVSVLPVFLEYIIDICKPFGQVEGITGFISVKSFLSGYEAALFLYPFILLRKNCFEKDSDYDELQKMQRSDAKTDDLNCWFNILALSWEPIKIYPNLSKT